MVYYLSFKKVSMQMVLKCYLRNRESGFEPKKVSKFRDYLIYLQQLSIFSIKIGNKEYCTHLGNKAAVEIVKDFLAWSGKNHIWTCGFPCNESVLFMFAVFCTSGFCSRCTCFASLQIS